MEVYRDGHKVVKGASSNDEEDDYTGYDDDDLVDRFSGLEEMCGETYGESYE